MPDITVIIPTWNRAGLLEKAVRSVLDQTLPPLEVLVCDDGSTDDSRKVIEAIGDSRVKWSVGIRGGRPAIPRNRGIRESRGEWLAFLDDDDEWYPEKLDRQMAALNEFNGLACCSNALRFIPDKGIVGPYLAKKQKMFSFYDLLKVNQVICSSALFHRSLQPFVGGFPEDIMLKAVEDYALWLRIATQCPFIYVHEPLLIYRDDATHSVRKDHKDDRGMRQAVLRDFKQWGGEQCIPANYLRKVEQQGSRDFINSAHKKLMECAHRLKKSFSP